MLKFMGYVAALLLPTAVQADAGAIQFSGVNKVSFVQSEYDKAFAGNGFLLDYKGEVYAITVKHVLFEANTPEMKSVSIDGHVEKWQIHPNKEPERPVILGELLNASKDEMLDMAILQKDWLVFRVKENRSSLVPIKLRETPLTQGDVVTAYGCSYANTKTCEQDAYIGSFVAQESANMRVAMPGLQPETLRGLSGSPVLDENNQLVGIVSNVFRSLDNSGFDFAPANLNYLKQVLAQL